MLPPTEDDLSGTSRHESDTPCSLPLLTAHDAWQAGRGSFSANGMQEATLQGRIQRLEERNRSLIAELARGTGGAYIESPAINLSACIPGLRQLAPGLYWHALSCCWVVQTQSPAHWKPSVCVIHSNVQWGVLHPTLAFMKFESSGDGVVRCRCQ